MPTELQQAIAQTKATLQKKQQVHYSPGYCKKIKAVDIFDFGYELGALLNTGVPIVHALELLIQSYQKSSVKTLLHLLKANIESGLSFSESLKKYPHVFDPLFCHLAQVGEQSGSLAAQLNQAASYKEHANNLKNKIKKALAYPTFVVLLSLIIIICILAFIIPQFQSLFDSFHGQLPLLTRCIIQLSERVKHNGQFVLLAFSGLLYSLYILRQHHLGFAYRIDQLILELPFVGQAVKHTLISKVCHILAITYRSGLPIPEAIMLLSNTTKNRVYIKAFESIYRQIKFGESLHTALAKTNCFPERMVQMIHIGEQSGSLDTMLEKIASYYQNRFNYQVDQMNRFLEPAVITLLGLAIGTVIIAMYLPIFKLGSLF